jgi:hypothetical protein
MHENYICIPLYGDNPIQNEAPSRKQVSRLLFLLDP